MKYFLGSLLLIFFSFFSCSRRLCACDPVPPFFYYKAEVVNTSEVNCSRPLIRIDPSDTAAVSRVSGYYTDMYVASQLPANLNTTGQKLYISIASFATGEDFSCTAVGVLYEHLKVITAMERN